MSGPPSTGAGAAPYSRAAAETIPQGDGLMYFLLVSVLLFAAPLASIAFEVFAFHASLAPALFSKWDVIWAVAMRLGTAGHRQNLQPEYTAREILGIQRDEATIVVRELGFANVAFGIVGALSLWFPSWIAPAALAGAAFLGL